MWICQAFRSAPIDIHCVSKGRCSTPCCLQLTNSTTKAPSKVKPQTHSVWAHFANSYHHVCVSVPKMTMSEMTYLFNIKHRQQGPIDNSLLPNSSILNQSSSQKGLRTCGTHCMCPRISWRTAFPFKMRFTSCDIDFNGLASLRPPRLDCSGASNNSNQHSQQDSKRR